MTIRIKDVEKIAELAKLQFSEEEKKRLATQLSTILEYVEKLNELDLTDVEPTYQVVASELTFREDEVGKGLSQSEALQNAPAKHGDFFSVPKVIRQK